MIRAPRTALFLAALCLAWLLAPPSSAADGPVAQRPVFHLGDSFTYAERFETVACRTWQVTQVDQGGNMLAARCGENTVLLAPDGGITRIVTDKGKELVAFKPEAAPIPFPLSVGLRWSYRFEVSTASQVVSPDIDETCEATAIEPVTVRGAALPAFRIECTDRWSVTFLSGSNTSILWYAPDARAVVKAVNPSAQDWSLLMTDYSFIQP
ncbi:MAG TPA: hypothetical protein VKP60_15250 [Magnetospirillaceae bacterium]|nr:hypothetical protein [Magnetospirillaceae bacterium]